MRKHPALEAIEAVITADYSHGYTDFALGLGFNNPKQSPEYEDGYNQARLDGAEKIVRRAFQ